MKISVIFGVGQMIFWCNFKRFKWFLFFKIYKFFLWIFIPQLIFICLLFGYMNILIFIKWNTDFTNKENPSSIISYMINMGIKFENIINDNPLWGKNSTWKFSKFIFIICIICVFIMFVPKRLILYYNNKKKQLNEEEQQKENNNNQKKI